MPSSVTANKPSLCYLLRYFECLISDIKKCINLFCAFLLNAQLTEGSGEYKGFWKMIYDSELHNGVIINQLPAVKWRNDVNNHTSPSQMPTKCCSRTSQTINESGKWEIHRKSQMRICCSANPLQKNKLKLELCRHNLSNVKYWN